MKRLQEFEIDGISIYVYVDEEGGIYEAGRGSETIEKIITETSDIILAPALLFAKQFAKSIKEMDDKPKKANLEFYTKIVAGSGKLLNVIVEGEAEASVKVSLEWELK